MKVLVINAKGGVGKSLVTYNVLVPFLTQNNSTLTVLETDVMNKEYESYVNSLILKTVQVEHIKNFDFPSKETNHVVYDVGSNSYNNFLEEFQYAREYFDIVFIPTLQKPTSLDLTLQTIMDLKFPNVYVVLNCYDINDDDNQYTPIFFKELKKLGVNNIVKVPFSSAFLVAEQSGYLLFDILKIFNLPDLEKDLKVKTNKQELLQTLRRIKLYKQAETVYNFINSNFYNIVNKQLNLVTKHDG